MLNAEIMERLKKEWRSAGFYETDGHRRIAAAVRTGLRAPDRHHRSGSGRPYSSIACRTRSPARRG